MDQQEKQMDQQKKMGPREKEMGQQEKEMGRQEKEMGQQEKEVGQQEKKMGQQEKKMDQQEKRMGQMEKKMVREPRFFLLKNIEYMFTFVALRVLSQKHETEVWCFCVHKTYAYTMHVWQDTKHDIDMNHSLLGGTGSTGGNGSNGGSGYKGDSEEDMHTGEWINYNQFVLLIWSKN